jgi:hypothetical protein
VWEWLVDGTNITGLAASPHRRRHPVTCRNRISLIGAPLRVNLRQ